jgi:hypothetical protein
MSEQPFDRTAGEAREDAPVQQGDEQTRRVSERSTQTNHDSASPGADGAGADGLQDR